MTGDEGSMGDDDQPATLEEFVDWLTEGFDRLGDETSCMAEHWRIFNDESEDDEEHVAALYSIVKHLETLHLGATVIMSTLMAKFIPQEMLGELVREKMELAEGSPIKMETVKLGDSGLVGFAFSREDVVVPDDISELED